VTAPYYVTSRDLVLHAATPAISDMFEFPDHLIDFPICGYSTPGVPVTVCGMSGFEDCDNTVVSTVAVFLRTTSNEFALPRCAACSILLLGTP
jgi:hypothetical protein